MSVHEEHFGVLDPRTRNSTIRKTLLFCVAVLIGVVVFMGTRPFAPDDTTPWYLTTAGFSIVTFIFYIFL